MFFYTNIAPSRDSERNEEGERETEIFLTGRGIVIGPLHAWTYKSTIADNPLFRINIVAFFSSTGGGSRVSNKHIATRNP